MPVRYSPPEREAVRKGCPSSFMLKLLNLLWERAEIRIFACIICT